MTVQLSSNERNFSSADSSIGSYECKPAGHREWAVRVCYGHRDGVVSKSGATLWCNRRQVLQDSLLEGENFCVKPGSILAGRFTGVSDAARQGGEFMLTQEQDQQLVERVQRGDKRAFDLLVMKYQHKILG